MDYNIDKAVTYAHRWAYARNPDYYNFNLLGGDCTNFMSQCLYMGCGVMNYTRDTGWYYESPNDRAAAWSGVEYLYRFLIYNKGPGPYASELPIDQARTGDIIQLSFDGHVFSHSLLVVEDYPQILISTHTADSDSRPLATYRRQLTRLIRIEGVRS